MALTTPAVATPNANPKTCAQCATPPPPDPGATLSINQAKKSSPPTQTGNTTQAGVVNRRTTKPQNQRMRMRVCGWRTSIAPSTPATAPDAPISGIARSGYWSAKSQAATRPAAT